MKGHPHQLNWADALPLVLLGIRTSLKADIGCTAAELVYGTTLRLPGGFFTSQDTRDDADPQSYVGTLKNRMRELRPTPPRSITQSAAPAAVSDALKNSSYVFIRHDAIRKPLQPPYDGPYKVLDRSPKYFTIDVKGRRDTVSVDRLKVAHLDDVVLPSTPSLPAVPTEPPTSQDITQAPQELNAPPT